MDGTHDLGGRQGFGPVRHSPQTQAFHAPWEKRVNAMYSLAVRMGVFNMDEYRHAIERMEPRHYMSATYYERSLTSLATLVMEKGLVSREELERREQATFPLALPAAAGRSNVTGPTSFNPGFGLPWGSKMGARRHYPLLRRIIQHKGLLHEHLSSTQRRTRIARFFDQWPGGHRRVL